MLIIHDKCVGIIGFILPFAIHLAPVVRQFLSKALTINADLHCAVRFFIAYDPLPTP